MFALVAVDAPVEVAEIPTVETWDRHDCKLHVSQPDGFTCKVQLRAKLDYPPEKVFDILVDPDNSRYFTTISAVTYRKVLENNRRGKQTVEVEQAASWRFLFWSGVFLTRLFVFQDRQEGVVEFRLAKEGLMKNFEGRWEIRPFDQHSLDEVSGQTTFLGNLAYRFQSFIGKEQPKSTLITLEQSILPKSAPPKMFQGIVIKASAKIIRTILEDLKGEVNRVKKGDPIPKSQLTKLQKAKKIMDSQIKKRQGSKKVPASLSYHQIHF